MTTNAPEGAATARCPQCGALNPADAEWCGLCLTRRESPQARAKVGAAPPSEQEGVARTTAAPGVTPGGLGRTAGHTRGAFTVTEKGVVWACGVCEKTNSIDEQVCAVCGASLAETLRPIKDKGPQRDPNTTALYSLLFPGAGHAYLGLWGQAIARGVMSVWVLLVVLVTGIQNGPLQPLPLLFAAISLGLWLTAAHDSYREAQRDPSMVLLKDRYVVYVVLGLLFLLFGLLLFQGLQASGAG